MKKVILAVLIIAVSAISCTKNVDEKKPEGGVIFVTAQAVDNDGLTTDFPVVMVKTTD